MKKNLPIKAAAKSMIAPVQQLQPGIRPQWGSMNATGMLLHANLCNEAIFEPLLPTQRTTVKQYLLRLLALYLAPRFKKGVRGDARKETRGKIQASQFEKEKARFIAPVRRFPEHKEPLALRHIALGILSAKEWGIAAYKHMDHHLRQFGV